MDISVDGDFEENGKHNLLELNKCLDRWEERRRVQEYDFQTKSKKRTAAEAGIPDRPAP